MTVNALAQRAGVSRAAFYSHFSGLDDLMGAMLGTMFDRQQERGGELAAQGRSIQEMVRVAAATMVAYVAHHQAFLRGALDWKFSHRTYLILVGTLSNLHVVALHRLRDQVPLSPPISQMARYFAGGSLDLLIQWLVDTEEDAREGRELAREPLLAAVLRMLPSWYTGLGPEDPIPEDLALEWLVADPEAGTS
ncbi:TetR/AcrR family transcriptional regulator [Brachybacterium sacelli]